MIETGGQKHGAEYDAAALRALVEARGWSVRVLARSCGVSDAEVKVWLYPPAGRRMHWKTMNRLRRAMGLTQEEVGRFWKGGVRNEDQC